MNQKHAEFNERKITKRKTETTAARENEKNEKRKRKTGEVRGQI
jgi:hypothetical protein